MYWMLAEDVGLIKGVEAPDGFVLTSDDNLALYLQYPWIRTKFGCTCNVIFDGVEMKAAYKARTRGKDIVIVQFIGDREARRTLNDHIRSLGLTLRDRRGVGFRNGRYRSSSRRRISEKRTNLPTPCTFVELTPPFN